MKSIKKRQKNKSLKWKAEPSDKSRCGKEFAAVSNLMTKLIK